MCEGQATPGDIDDDKIYKDTPNPFSGADGLDYIHMNGFTYYAGVNWLCDGEQIEVHGDSLDFYQIGKNTVFAPWTNPNTTTAAGDFTDILIRLVDEASDGIQTVEIDMNAPPRAPQNVSLSGVWGGHPTISWDPNPEPDHASYEVFRRTKPYSGQWSAWAKKTETTDTSWTDPGFILEKPGTGVVGYFVKATDQSGQRSAGSDTVGTSGNSFGIGLLSKQNQTKTVDVLPAKYALAQNTPNPFNPITTIPYQLPEQSMVTLRVYSLRGGHIVTLQNSIQDAGFHQMQWDGTDENGHQVASGPYLYHLTAQSQESEQTYQQTLKMLYLK